MEPLYQQVSFWWALGLGLVLMTLELFLPTTLFLWTGLSCVVVAIPMAFVPGFTLLQALSLWVLLSVLVVLLAKKVFSRHPDSGERMAAAGPPNQYGREFVGQTAVLVEDTENRQTRVNFRGANWGVKVPGGDLKAGTRIRVTAVEGIYLIAESQEN